MNNNSDIPKNWLITGGCGFIGTNLIEHLVLNYDCKIRVVDNLSVGTMEDLANVCDFIETDKPIDKTDKVELWVGDILNKELAIKATAGMDCIVHLAANSGVFESVKDPRKDMEVNVVGTFNLLEAARINGVKQFVFASSGAPAGEIEPPIHEEIVPHPVSPYGSSKLAGEGYCSSYSRTFGINTVMLRFGNVYGPGSTHKTSVVSRFINNVINGNPCKIYGDGSQTRDFIFIDDLVDAIINASTFHKGGEVFQIASGEELSILKLTNYMGVIFTNLGYRMEIEFEEERAGDVMHNYSDIFKAKRDLDWIPKTTIKRGLEITINAYLTDNDAMTEHRQLR